MVGRVKTLLLLLLAACGSTPPPGPSEDRTSILALAVRTTLPMNSNWGRPDTVFFVKLDPGQDPLRGKTLLRSNYAHGGIAYLLDAEPGRYAAVGCSEKRDGRDYFTFFGNAFIQKTLRTLEAGRFDFLGSFEVALGRGDLDRAQQHYRPLIVPQRKSALVRVFERSRYFKERDFRELDNGDRLAAEAREHLSPSGWGDRFGDR